MVAINENTIVKKSNEIFVEPVADDNIIALNVSTGTFVSIDYVGKFILDYIEEPRTIGSIISRLKDAFECPEDIASDVYEFITMAYKEKFIFLL